MNIIISCHDETSYLERSLQCIVAIVILGGAHGAHIFGFLIQIWKRLEKFLSSQHEYLYTLSSACMKVDAIHEYLRLSIDDVGYCDSSGITM